MYCLVVTPHPPLLPSLPPLDLPSFLLPRGHRLWHLRRLMDDPTYVETWVDDHACYGHNPTDIQPFHHLFLGEESDWSTTYDVTDDVMDDVMGHVTDDVPGHVTGHVTDDVMGHVTGHVTENVTGHVTDAVTDAVMTDVMDDVTNAVTDDVTADVRADVKGRGGGDVAPVKTYYTNEMLYDLLAPDSMKLPYIYDNFEWQHCDVSCSKVKYASVCLVYVLLSYPVHFSLL